MQRAQMLLDEMDRIIANLERAIKAMEERLQQQLQDEDLNTRPRRTSRRSTVDPERVSWV